MKARYKALVDNFSTQIREGTLAAGHRLPTHRQLASQERISLATATRVYAELEEMGLVSGEAGRGTFVREITLHPHLGVDQLVVANDMIDLNFNYPSLPEQASLLRDALRKLTTTGDIESFLRYTPHGGRLQERATIARYLSGLGLKPAAEDVLIVNGAQQGLSVALSALLKPGDVVAVDALTYPGFRSLAEFSHLELAAVSSTPHGPDFEQLVKLCEKRRVKAIYTMPTLHNPLGWVLSHEQRTELVRIARLYDLLIIEDAAYAYLIPDAPEPLWAYAPERTVYVNGFSKNVAAGLRVGMIVCSENTRAALERGIRLSTWNTPSLMTAIVCGWIDDGTVSRLETLKRLEARDRQTLARSIFHGMPYISHPASYFLWLPLPEDVRSETLIRSLMDEQISVSSASPYSSGIYVPHAIRLALASLTEERLTHALTRVRETIHYWRDF
ncbi:PLP-dependent aminotransferase family protein [Candidatus Pantoea formicae]|uniref:aminotransferase-like domain-containing protein n=1 Tax=Candidatus Pantoea formicae TaxID=2608355 RepID=UPI003ED8D7F2